MEESRVGEGGEGVVDCLPGPLVSDSLYTLTSMLYSPLRLRLLSRGRNW